MAERRDTGTVREKSLLDQFVEPTFRIVERSAANTSSANRTRSTLSDGTAPIAARRGPNGAMKVDGPSAGQ